MKIFIFLLIVLVSGCTMTILPLKGTYPTTPMQFQSSKSFDEVWDRLIDVFAQKGLDIKIIDRSSGLIISQHSLLITTCESGEGIPIDPTATLVVPKVYIGSIKKYEPITKASDIGPYSTKEQIKNAGLTYGDWNVRIKSEPYGCLINVNIVNVTYSTPTLTDKVLTSYKSTGVFEKTIADLIK